MAGRSGTEITAKADKLVAERIRHYRTERGLTQNDLAQALGISLDKIKKFESRDTRVSVAVLYEIANTLRVPIDAFFADADHADATPRPEADSDANDLIADFQDIEKRDVRATISGLVKSICKSGL